MFKLIEDMQHGLISIMDKRKNAYILFVFATILFVSYVFVTDSIPWTSNTQRRIVTLAISLIYAISGIRLSLLNKK